MPNWCENDLHIKGSDLEIARFLNRVKTSKTEFDFNTLIPYPDKFQVLDDLVELGSGGKDGFNSGGYHWCLQNWGTKWNSDVTDVQQESGEAIIHFSTAWSPPAPVIIAASRKFPELSFDLRYFEQGAGFQGTLKVKNGKVEKDETKDYEGNRGG